MSDRETSEQETPPDSPPGQNKFDIRLNGEKIYSVNIDPRLVTGVRMFSSAGEVGVAGIPFSGEGSNWVGLTLDVQQPTSLPVVEDDARLAAQEEGPDEVDAYNPVAAREAEELETNPDGSQEVPERTESSDVVIEPTA